MHIVLFCCGNDNIQVQEQRVHDLRKFRNPGYTCGLHLPALRSGFTVLRSSSLWHMVVEERTESVRVRYHSYGFRRRASKRWFRCLECNREDWLIRQRHAVAPFYSITVISASTSGDSARVRKATVSGTPNVNSPSKTAIGPCVRFSQLIIGR